MYCKNCGNKLDDNSKFCNSCGCKVDGVINSSISNDSTEARKKALNQADALLKHFRPKKQEYEDLKVYTCRLDEQHNIKLVCPAMIIGCLLLLAFISGLFMEDSFDTVSIIALLAGLALVGYSVFRYKKSLQTIEDCNENIWRITDELGKHYSNYMNCPVGPEFTNPATLEKIKHIIELGRASSIEQAVNLMLDDEHKSVMEYNAKLSSKAALQTAKNTKTIAVFTAADFLFK